MAKIIIAGDAIVINSTLKLEDINLVQKFSASSLVLKGGEDGKEPIFALRTGKTGSLDNYGAVFAAETRDGSGLATMTLSVPADVTDVKTYIVDHFGGALANLMLLEENLPTVIESIKCDRAALMESIQVLQ